MNSWEEVASSELAGRWHRDLYNLIRSILSHISAPIQPRPHRKRGLCQDTTMLLSGFGSTLQTVTTFFLIDGNLTMTELAQTISLLILRALCAGASYSYKTAALGFGTPSKQ
jgi:hypothetical protein